MTDSVLTLNVGGVLYTTTTATLLRFPDSMLGTLVCHRLPSTKDINGNLFIDRDGECFKHVLNFLRSSQLRLPSDFKDFDLLMTEADFYQIRPLIDALAEFHNSSTPPVKIGRTFYLEIIEVRSGSTATVPTSNSRVKTIVIGRKDVLLTLLPGVVGSDFSERLCNREPEEYTEIELFGTTAMRLRVGEELKNTGWCLVSSNLSTSSGYDSSKSMFGIGLIIEQTFRDRWSREFEMDEITRVNKNHTMLLEEANA